MTWASYEYTSGDHSCDIIYVPYDAGTFRHFHFEETVGYVPKVRVKNLSLCGSTIIQLRSKHSVIDMFTFPLFFLRVHQYNMLCLHQFPKLKENNKQLIGSLFLSADLRSSIYFITFYYYRKEKCQSQTVLRPLSNYGIMIFCLVSLLFLSLYLNLPSIKKDRMPAVRLLKLNFAQ